MTFLDNIKTQYGKVSQTSIITNLWKEIISGKRSEFISDDLIQYSFHYPVDTDIYMEELIHGFEDCLKDELRTIDGDIKAYLLTFLYYCMGARSRIPLKTSLSAAELYFKLIILSKDVGKLFYEKNLLVMALQLLNICIKNNTIPEELCEKVMTVLSLTYQYVMDPEVPLIILQAIVNLFANIVKYRATEEDIKKNEPTVKFCFESLKNIILLKDQPKELEITFISVLRILEKAPKEEISEKQRKRIGIIIKQFIQQLMEGIEEKNKLCYLIDSLFFICGSQDLENIQDFTALINVLDEELYKEFVLRIPRYLESKNHQEFHLNLMKVVHMMLSYPHPSQFSKLDVLFSLCIKNIVLHLVNKKKQIQYFAIDILAKIFLLRNNAVVDGVFELVNVTGAFGGSEKGIDTTNILVAMKNILKDPYAGSAARCKHVLHILSKMLISLNRIDGNLSRQVLYLICKDGTPFSIKNFLPNLHELYVGLSVKKNCDARYAIMRILFKMAMHTDASSSVFVKHLYEKCVFNSNLNDESHGPEQYLNVLFSDEFDYTRFLSRCRSLISYDHVYHCIENLKHKEPGYPVFLNALLDYVQYKECDNLTTYITEHFLEISSIENSDHLLNAYRRILMNKERHSDYDKRKFEHMNFLLWDSLFHQTCGISIIKATFNLIETLKNICDLPDDEAKKTELLTQMSERAYRALQQQHIHQGSIMHLTEICIALRRLPSDEILTIFQNVLDHPQTSELLKTRYKDTFIQLLSFFGTIAMMNRPNIPVASKYLTSALHVSDPIVQLSAIKIYYTIAKEIDNEYDDIIKFCFKQVTSKHAVLSRVCLVILEELIHENYVLLNSEDFIRFTHRLGSFGLNDFLQHLLSERFVVSNKHDVGRFYMSTLVFMSGHTKLQGYPIPLSFREDLALLRNLIDCPNDMIQFLFNVLQTKTQFNILKEISLIFDCLVKGNCKVDEEFFEFISYSLFTFKVMTRSTMFDYKPSFYMKVCKSIEKQLLIKDPKFNLTCKYGEYEKEIKDCTRSLFDLLFFIQNEETLQSHMSTIFDTLACWIDHIKAELEFYIHYEKSSNFQHSLQKFVSFYKEHKQDMDNFIIRRER